MSSGIALTSKCRFRHGALVVRHSKILGYSPNLERNNPKFVGWQHASVHAEARALKRAGFPTRATVFVSRINRAGKSRLSKPCSACQELIDSLNCRVVWTENE